MPVEWSRDHLSPDWPTSALVMIDVQHDFVDGAAPIPETLESLPEMRELAVVFRRAGRPIFHIVRSYLPGESDVDLIRRRTIEGGARIVAPDSRGAGIPAELLPDGVDVVLDWNLLRPSADRAEPHAIEGSRPQQIGADEYVLYKPRWSAFYRTPLEDLLREKGITTVVVAGCNLPNCPRATLFDASERDFRTVLVPDATSQVTEERLADLALIGVRIRTVADIQTSLR